MPGYHKRTIKKILRNKVSSLLASIDNPELVEKMRRDILVTGGCITSMLIGEKVNDYDIYFRTRETTLAVAKYYVDKYNEGSDLSALPSVVEESRRNIAGENEDRILITIKSDGVAGEPEEDEPTDEVVLVEDLAETLKKPGNLYKPIFLTDNAINLTDKTQLIIRFYGSPEEIHRNFDFVHCTGVYDFWSGELHITQEMAECLLSKTLVYRGSLYPLASILRTRKFIKRGWRISAGQMLKIMEQVSHVRFDDVEQLKEQLLGVDVAYMSALIAALASRDPGQRIDATYLGGLIDEIFED